MKPFVIVEQEVEATKAAAGQAGKQPSATRATKAYLLTAALGYPRCERDEAGACAACRLEDRVKETNARCTRKSLRCG
jgi:hypothetical protein